MSTQKKRVIIRTSIIVITILLGLGMGVSGCKRKPASAGAQQPPASTPAQPVRNTATTPPPKPVKSSVLPMPKIELKNVIAAAKSWTAKEIEFGGAIPDLSLTDLEGTVHKLSDYRGRNVILNFWAPLFPHSKVELPQLAQLRNEVKPDELAILAISITNNENTEASIRQAVQAQTSINYPIVALAASSLPKPLNEVEFLPCNFFIDKQGEIKIVTEGLVPVQDMKSILRAQ